MPLLSTEARLPAMRSRRELLGFAVAPASFFVPFLLIVSQDEASPAKS
jgi:hypothetical protein